MRKRSKLQRILSLLMALVMILGYLPAQHVHAASNVEGGLEGQDADVFSALGFDTSVEPEGYDADTTDNPYGREKLTGNQIFEMVIGSSDGIKQAGDDNNSVTVSGTVGSLSGTQVPLEIFNGAAGDFDGDGLPGEIIYVGFPTFAANVPFEDDCESLPVQMYLYDGKDSSFSGSNEIATVDVDRENTFLLVGFGTGTTEISLHQYADIQDDDLFGYQEVTAGDYDGDGFSEIAVYVPASGNARIDIYKWMRDENSSADDWKDWGNWNVVWSRPVSSSDFVPNMVSLVSSDINRDGIDDLGIAYSGIKRKTYTAIFRYEIVETSSAAILWGDRNNMLQTSSSLDLCESELGTQFRTSLTVGDINGDGYDELVATGQPKVDFASNTTRSIAVYSYDGNGSMAVLYSGNQMVVDGAYKTSEVTDDEGNTTTSTTWESNNGFDGEYLSQPLMRTNAAVLKLEGYDYNYLYLDSCIYEYIEGSLNLKMCLDDKSYDGNNTLGTTWLGSKPYVEYGAAAADLNGDGFDQLYASFWEMDGEMVCSVTVPIDNPNTTDINELEAYDSTRKLGRIAYHAGGYSGLQGNGSGALSAKSYSRTVNLDEDYTFTVDETVTTLVEDYPYYLAIPADVDRDTTIIKYTGLHYLTYSDPEVLAIIAAAPYFKDVDIISDYDYAWQNTTSWTTTEGESHGTLVTVDLEAGAFYASHKVVSSVLIDLETSVNFTMEYEQSSTSTTEYSLTFETSQNEDAVAFFSIPMEHYVYLIGTPNDEGEYDYKEQKITNQFQPVYQVLNLDYYESIRLDHEDQLPAIAGVALTSTPGDPGSYPSSTNGYDVISQWNKDAAGVSFGNGAITQEITVTEEEAEMYNLGCALDTQLGFGGKVAAPAIGLVNEAELYGGIQFSLNPGGGWTDMTMTGTTISGTVTNMPLEFQDYGYYYNWKIFSYAYSFGDSTIPVISYIVNDVQEPPILPVDFQQDVERTTADTNVLTWTYDGEYSKFIIYKYFDFPVGGGLQEVASYESGETPFVLKYDAEGNPYKEFYFEDTNLAPYSEYKYAIQVERLSKTPPLSAPSSLLTARTKASVGNPVMTITESDGTDDGILQVYPDRNGYLTANVNGPGCEDTYDYYSTVQYQWQKKERGAWTDQDNKTGKTLTFASAGKEIEGEYRARINVLTNSDNTAISTYTSAVQVTHSKRTSLFEEVYVRDVKGGVELYAKVDNAHTDSGAIPSGDVVFNLTHVQTGMPYQYTGTLDGTGTYTEVISSTLPAGTYTIKVSYTGSKIFKSCVGECVYLSQTEKGYSIDSLRSVTYGEGAQVTFNEITTINGYAIQIPVDAETIVLIGDETHTYTGDGSWNRTPVGEEAPVPSGYTLIQNGDPVIKGRNYIIKVLSNRGSSDSNDPNNYDWYHRFTAEVSGIVERTSWSGTLSVYYKTDLGYLTGSDTGLYTLADNTPAGSYTIVARSDSGDVTERDITVVPRPITLQLPTEVKKQDAGLTMGDITYGELAVTSGSWAPCDTDEEGNVTGTLASESVTPSYSNTAGKAFDKDAALDTCGYYEITAVDGLDNYAVTFRSGSLSVIGGNKPVTFGVRPFEGQEVGTLYMVSPDYAYTREELGITLAQAVGSRVIFTAAPDEGYQVYDWYVDGVAQGITDTRFAHVMLNQETTVEVQFVFKPDTLVFGIAGAAEGGTLTVSDSSLTSGSILIPNSYVLFTANALPGYHFKEWRYTELGNGTAYYSEDDGSMSSTFELIMPKTSCSLYAVFERDGYTFTYTDKNGINGLTAWYWGSTTGDTTAALEKITVNSGDTVPGDTQIVLQAKDGYALDADYNFVSTGDQGVADYNAGTYTLTLTQDTEVTGYTVQNSFDLTVKLDVTSTYHIPEGTKIHLTIGSMVREYEATASGEVVRFEDVPGGTFVTVDVEYPDYYTCGGWLQNDVELGYEKYTVAMAKDNVFTLKLTEDPVYKVTLADISGKGTYSVTLPEGAGQEGNVVTCHENDPLTIQITPESGYTVIYWNVASADAENSWETKASSLKYQFPQLTADYTFTPIFSGNAYYTVSWPTLTYYGVTLTPEEGCLTTVVSGGEFKFTLSGGEDAYEYVLVNGLKFYSADGMGSHYPYRYEEQDGVRIYTISNVTGNQEISVSAEEPVYGVKVTPETAEVPAGKTITLTAEGYGFNAEVYTWSTWDSDEMEQDILQRSASNTFVYEAPKTPGEEVTIILQAGNYSNGAEYAITANHVTLTITDAADTVAISTADLTAADDGSYLIYPITPDNSVGTYDFDALVTMYSGETNADVTWTLWGAQMRGTSVDADGRLTVSPREYGTNGQLKLIAAYTYSNGDTDKQEVVINLCPDAYVATEVIGSVNGEAVKDIHGTVSTVGYVSDGETVTVTASPAENHAVAKWYINGVEVSAEAVNTLSFSAEEMTHYTVSVEFTHNHAELKHNEVNHWYECSCGDMVETEEHHDFDKEHHCDDCGYKMTECDDADKDHFCDWCGVRLTECYDKVQDHFCDWCGDMISTCIDEDPTDHVCDWCGGNVGGECADSNSNHFCDHCGEKLTECADESRDHNCDICGRELTKCADGDSDHACDICGEALSECADTDPVDHKCDLCGETTSQCLDNDNDHNCDACGKEDITVCADGSNDHKCDICGEIISVCADSDGDHSCDLCGTKLSDCGDGDNDHACDICGGKLSDCADGDNDHACDTCGEKLSDCADGDNDHACDACGGKLTDCADGDNDHYCDTCGKHLSACEDEDADGTCDICHKELNAHDCTDGNSDHLCDTCGSTVSECDDTEPADHKCDICGETVSQCADSDTDTDHSCDTCGAVLSDCADTDNDHKCDTCSSELSKCADDTNDHKCDICGTVVSQCGDEDSDHKCDICGTVLSQCADEDNDHKCDVCGTVLSQCAEGETADHKCDICSAELADLHTDEDNDHACDLETCGKVLSQCLDGNNDHACDTCGDSLSECADENNDHDCDICGKEDISDCTDEDDHICDTCGETVSECTDTDPVDHICDICDKVLSQCGDENADGTCDDCNAEMHECLDAEDEETGLSDHLCDTCGYQLTECLDEDKDHLCDICGESSSLCTDETGDHNCDICGDKFTDCADGDSDHKCDICGGTVSDCADADHNDVCDICGGKTWVHADTDNDHRCDACALPLSECADDDKDHKCDVCGIVWTVCADADTNHICDICTAAVGDHVAAEGSHICDYCGEVASDCADVDPQDHKCDVCSEVLSDCGDTNNDHNCDICAVKLTDCADENKDHNCDLCGEKLTECTDEDKDHHCDLCGITMSECADATGDHRCDHCDVDMGECVDEDRDHICDIAGETLSECADPDRDHNCDHCGNKISDCGDTNDDHMCDVCGERVSEDADVDKDHLCDVCKERISDCADGNNDHICDVCGFLLSECADEDKDHACDVCGEILSDCADEDSDHLCDTCGETVSECVDEDKDGACDSCEDFLGIRVTFPEGDDTGTIQPGAAAEVDGKRVQVNEDGELWLSEAGGRLLITYEFHEDEDPHKEYPTAMYVWYLTWTDENGDGEADTCTAERISQLDNFLNYKGTSIRVSKNSETNGIRFFTDVPAAAQTALTKGTLLTGTLEGYKLVEMGTLYKWADGTELTIGSAASYVYGGDAGSKFRLFSKEGGYNRFTGMLVGLEGDAQTLSADILSRPFAILENASGDRITLYGGSIQRSIYYVALQNRDYWAEGSAYDTYVENIISTVEGA